MLFKFLCMLFRVNTFSSHHWLNNITWCWAREEWINYRSHSKLSKPKLSTLDTALCLGPKNAYLQMFSSELHKPESVRVTWCMYHTFNMIQKFDMDPAKPTNKMMLFAGQTILHELYSCNNNLITLVYLNNSIALNH